MPSDAIRPFHLDIPQETLDDLHRRLDATRWPERETVDGWEQGAPLEQVQALCARWRDDYDWRACEARLNGLGQFVTELDGLDIHFLHVRSPEPNALPLLITHGWPGSVIEFLEIIGPLTDPVAHGGRAEDAFHVVAPSLPGYGFSGRPARHGWSVERTARAWSALMARLGYDRWVAQGGDWGSAVTNAIARLGLDAVAGVHFNFVPAVPSEKAGWALTEFEQRARDKAAAYQSDGNAYALVQGTRPQTIGYGLVDSPAALAAWIYEKFEGWTDCDGDPRSVFDTDALLDNIMLYWLPATGASAARLYWESFRSFASAPIDIPVAASIFPHDIFVTSRRFAERKYRQLIHWNVLHRGGHFAAFEQPSLFVDELRDGFRSLR